MTDTVKIAIITAITTIIIKLTNKNKTKKNVQKTETNTDNVKR